ncbi:hypothetical protein L1887_31796 [Cichorium endivia]|nr:hypothetical protein L1887_31796 [Cichorium endivia]
MAPAIDLRPFHYVLLSSPTLFTSDGLVQIGGLMVPKTVRLFISDGLVSIRRRLVKVNIFTLDYQMMLLFLTLMLLSIGKFKSSKITAKV